MAPRRTGALALGIGLGLGLGPALGRATIEEQRQRLPPPAFECGDDPIAGVWQAHTYYGHVGQWYTFALDVRRDADDPSGAALRGTIQVVFWDGDASRSQPPLCDAPGDRGEVFENARGEARDLELRFDAVDWRDTGACGGIGGGYLLDRFSGTVDPERMEFQSVLNADAPQWRDVPTVFRRVRCPPPDASAEPEPEPRVVLAPPPYAPPEREGCGLRGG